MHWVVIEFTSHIILVTRHSHPPFPLINCCFQRTHSTRHRTRAQHIPRTGASIMCRVVTHTHTYLPMDGKLKPKMCSLFFFRFAIRTQFCGRPGLYAMRCAPKKKKTARKPPPITNTFTKPKFDSRAPRPKHEHEHTHTCAGTPAKRLWSTNFSRPLCPMTRTMTTATRQTTAATPAERPTRASHPTMSCSSACWSEHTHTHTRSCLHAPLHVQNTSPLHSLSYVYVLTTPPHPPTHTRSLPIGCSGGCGCRRLKCTAMY